MTIERKKCSKHRWHKIEVSHVYRMDLSPGGLNYLFPNFFVKVCLSCGKVKGWRR